jgi:hypothetical protein
MTRKQYADSVNSVLELTLSAFLLSCASFSRYLRREPPERPAELDVRGARFATRVLGAREAGLALRWGAGRAAGARPPEDALGAGFAARLVGVREAAVAARFPEPLLPWLDVAVRGAAALFAVVGRPTGRAAAVLAREGDAGRALGAAYARDELPAVGGFRCPWFCKVEPFAPCVPSRGLRVATRELPVVPGLRWGGDTRTVVPGLAKLGPPMPDCPLPDRAVPVGAPWGDVCPPRPA